MVYYCPLRTGTASGRAPGGSLQRELRMARKRYLIVGDGAAGLTAAEELRKRDEHAAIGVLSDDPNPGYYRAALTNFLLGELREDQLWSVAPDFYESRRIQRMLARVTAVDPSHRQVWCSGHPAPLGYDALLIASGARARAPSFPGSHWPGVMTLRSVQDARRVSDLLTRGISRAAVLGGGALGLEWASALLERGVKVTLVERSTRFMPSALDAVASDLLAARLRQAGVEIVLGDEAALAEPGPSGWVGALTTRQGRRFECQLVAAALGIVPNSELVSRCGIALANNGAIRVDRKLQTSAPGIWASGDVAEVEGEQLGLWEPARRQGRVAALNMTGAAELYQPGAHYFATRLFDLDFARVGDVSDAPNAQQLVDLPRGTGHIAYRKISIADGRVRGALLIGERQAKVRAIGRGLKRLLDAKADVSAVAARLLDPSFDFSAFLETRKLVAAPRFQPAGTQARPAAKLRGTQALSLGSALPNLHASAGTALLERAAAPAAPAHTASPAGLNALGALLGTQALPSSAVPRQTRLLSIGLKAEAAPQLAGLGGDARLEYRGQILRISGKLCNIGSGPDCTIRLNDPSVAPLHAQICEANSALFLRDAGSPGGTRVSGMVLGTAHHLHDGDQIQLGGAHLVFRSSAPGASPLAATPPPEPLAPRLELCSGPGTGLSFLLSQSEHIIGSDAAAYVHICDPSIAPRHARVRLHAELHYFSDLGSASGSFVRGRRLAVGEEVVLGEGEQLKLGNVVLSYTRAPARDALAAFRPRARLSMASGNLLGSAAEFEQRALVGSAAECELSLPGLFPHELEFVRHHGNYFVRSLAGHRTFRGGAALGPEFVPLASGDLLLLQGGAMLRFEEL
jgi:NADPH-dependent 2,4-dienoyl-CoA reductase/sulfur reductase-like enzyme/pSer/pThr/pTyr-binding forkhead associated (FHA) protein